MTINNLFNICTHYFSGAVLFNLHALDLLLWKQMHCKEITAALIAETLIELGISIVTPPDEVHWPNGVVSTATDTGKKKKGGKKAEKKISTVYLAK